MKSCLRLLVISLVMMGAGMAGCDVDTSEESAPADWVQISAGDFWMGSPDGTCPEDYPGGASCTPELGRSNTEGREELHHVTLTTGFQIMSLEVTQEDFTAVMGWNPSSFASCGATCPVEQVSWYDAVAYANELSKEASLPECYVLSNVVCAVGTTPEVGSDYLACYGQGAEASGGINDATVALVAGVSTPYACTGYRLPMEAESEYATRAGSLTALYPSDGNDGEISETDCVEDANLEQIGEYCGNNGVSTVPVGGKAPNAWGLYDMTGNVWEWVWDGDGPLSADPVTDPTGAPSSSKRVVRGCSWRCIAMFCRSAFRFNGNPDSRLSNFGFRLARSTP